MRAGYGVVNAAVAIFAESFNLANPVPLPFARCVFFLNALGHQIGAHLFRRKRWNVFEDSSGVDESGDGDGGDVQLGQKVTGEDWLAVVRSADYGIEGDDAFGGLFFAGDFEIDQITTPMRPGSRLGSGSRSGLSLFRAISLQSFGSFPRAGR